MPGPFYLSDFSLIWEKPVTRRQQAQSSYLSKIADFEFHKRRLAPLLVSRETSTCKFRSNYTEVIHKCHALSTSPCRLVAAYLCLVRRLNTPWIDTLRFSVVLIDRE
jgi:hypothetical protein